jgi:hypothetical protein
LEFVASDLNVQQADRNAGYSPAYSKKASRLLKRPVVARAIEAIQAQGRTMAAYGLVEAMKEAEFTAAFAREHRNPMALLKATELRTKLSGLLIDRLEVVPPIDLKGALEQARNRLFNITPRYESASMVLTAGPTLFCRSQALDE